MLWAFLFLPVALLVGFMPEIIDISVWSELSWFNTGGTRAKKYVQSIEPGGGYYYFKRSEYKAPSVSRREKDYKFEFWGEIIAYEVGLLLGFHVLRYDLALDHQVMGCISKSMVDGENEELIEGVKYLQGYDNEYKPENKDHRSYYSFQLIESALTEFSLDGFMNHIVEMMVFDALIGNGDRHQENWAMLIEYTHFDKTILEHVLEHSELVSANHSPNWFVKAFKARSKKEAKSIAKLYLQRVIDFAPLYDNGSSLGRELTQEKVVRMLRNEQELIYYIRRGKSEIHWHNEKLNHFTLLEKLLQTKYKGQVQQTVRRIVENFDNGAVQRIIHKVDENVPSTHLEYKIPVERKDLIYKIIQLRVDSLRNLLNEGV